MPSVSGALVPGTCENWCLDVTEAVSGELQTARDLMTEHFGDAPTEMTVEESWNVGGDYFVKISNPRLRGEDALNWLASTLIGEFPPEMTSFNVLYVEGYQYTLAGFPTTE